MHQTITSSASLLGDLIGFTTGLVITLLLLVLTVRAVRLPGTPRANIFFALSALAWNVGGLACTLLLVGGACRTNQAALAASAVQFTGAAVWPVAMLAIWRPFAVLGWQQLVFRLLLIAAPVSGALIVVSVWGLVFLGAGLIDPTLPKHYAAFSASFLAVSAAVALRGFHHGRAEGRLPAAGFRFSSLMILVGVLAISAALVVLYSFHLSETPLVVVTVVTHQAPLLIVLGAFFQFARFRFADLFIRHSLRVLLAAAVAVVLVLVWRADLVAAVAAQTAFSSAARLFAGSLLAAVLLLSFTQLDRRMGAFVDRWIVRLPDYRRAARQLRETLDRLHAEPDITRAAEDSVRITLELEEVRVVPVETLPASLLPPETADGEVVELDRSDPLRHLLPAPNAELLVPVRIVGQVTALLVAAPGQARRGLVTHEVGYLRTVAMLLGSRLAALQLEREMVERRSRETLLLQQLTEAELRALRAQINPHFLFNSLNTIADLIVTSPASAEAMTLRLAKVFRYVLAHTSRPLTSIREEVDFLQAYLQIEQARFNGRLRVRIDVPADLARARIPSLILQPLVENALKHGLAPKLGPGELRISARAEGDAVCLTVEDDGIGVSPSILRLRPGASVSGVESSTRAPAFHERDGRLAEGERSGESNGGVGLVNVAQRLAVLYEDRAQLSLEAREIGGTRASIRIPRETEAAAV